MKSRDERYARRKYSANPLVSQGQKALEQCLAPVMDFARLLQTTVSKFDDKGRPDHKVKEIDFPCIVTPSGPTSRRSTGSGDRSSATFNVIYLPPYSLNIGDILVHDTFGTLKIDGFDNTAQFGVTSATATKINAGWDIEDGTALRAEPKDLF